LRVDMKIQRKLIQSPAHRLPPSLQWCHAGLVKAGCYPGLPVCKNRWRQLDML
jgi:hypothetical protein